MNNSEKAKEIAMRCPACSCLWTKDMMYKQEYCKDCVPQDRFTGAMEMAQWKDEQFSHYLKERAKKYAGACASQRCSLYCELDEIHRELFGESVHGTIPQAQTTHFEIKYGL